MIRWLHISDLHLNDDNFSSAMLRDDLPSFLKQRIKKCDYVFCTGDIRSANRLPNTFTESMADYMKKICDAVNVPVERLFIVPGNHDVNIYAEGREEAIRNIISGKGYYKPKYGHVNSEDLECIQRGKEDFVNFLSKIYDPERCGLYKDSNAPHFCIETTDFNVLHVDTTLVYSQSGKATDLLVGLEKLYSVVSKMNRQKPTILITHYPFTSLLQDERKLLAVVLQKNDVRLWLAGHEHDHNLQKIKYLNSLQAGELHYEDNANATILTGEYDPLTGLCCVRAYTWLEEGWAEYPIVDLDGDQMDVYKFQLGQQSKAEKEIIDTATCKNANSHFYYRMPAKVEQNLIPKIHSCCGINDNLDTLLAKTWGTDSPHLVLLADGGMGKTTMLLDYCKKAETPVLYVSAEQLAGIDMGIVQYCARCICGGDVDLFEKCLSAKSRKPVLTVLVDGMNEVDGASERKFIKEIQRLSLSDGLQMVISSRSDFTVRYSLPTFTRADVCALGEDDIKVMFSEEEWNGIVKSENLKRLLGNPMMVTVYKEICSVVDDYRNVSFLNWKFPITCNADMFHNYYVAQQALMMLRGQVEANKMLLSQICIDEILPSVAYRYESSCRMSVDDCEFRKLLIAAIDAVDVDSDAANAIRQYYRETAPVSIGTNAVIDFLTQETRLLYMEQGTTAFPHQMFRDYLSAKYIVRRTECKNDVLALWNSRQLPYCVMANIRQLDKQYWRNTAERVRQEAANAKTDVSVLVQNMFDAFPSGCNGNVANYSGIDLRGITLPANIPASSRVSLRGAAVDNVTLGISMGTPVCHTHLTLSSDKKFLATWANGRIYIFLLGQPAAPFVFDFGKNLSKMLFLGNRLFVLSGKIYVFENKNGWVFSGDIGEKDGVCRKLKSVIVKDDELHLYYPNREVVYSLTCFSRKEINNGKDLWRHPVDGHDISALNRYEEKKFDNSRGEIDKTGDESLAVVSYADGRLVSLHGDDVANVIVRGKSRLKDATISGDGSKAVTLSYEVFAERRRVQLWDLDNGMKTEELTCPGCVDDIHLSENGNWMLGRISRQATWIYDVRRHREQMFEENFLSSNRGKIFCNDDCVVRKQNGKVFCYNLQTGKSTPMDCPVADPSLICILGDNSVAAVDEAGYTAKMRSFRDGSLLTFHGKYSAIESIALFKEQPFIAVAMADGRLDIYHTGNGATLRHLQLPAKNSIVTTHPQKTIIAESDGRRMLKTHYYFETCINAKKRGWWKEHLYGGPRSMIDGDILDIGFNLHNSQLVAVLSNGRIVFCSDDWTDYKYSFNIITAFDVSAYDFSEVTCFDELKDVLRRNRALA